MTGSLCFCASSKPTHRPHPWHVLISTEEKAKEILLCDEIQILITLGDGDAKATAWGCDLTYDYVKINGDYRT